MYEKFEQGKLLQVSLLINLETTLQAFQEKINDIYIEYANQYNIDEGEYHLDIIYDRKNATVKINKIDRVVRFPTIGVLEDLPGVIIVSLNQKFYFGVSFIDFSIKNISKTRK
ncbi:hypothetical protein TVAG_387560 [Trichomonas vaginalis G3]|uniref:DUF7777 domain-containing protein n=1 Tax=Trichomonas vaginalis (strain ATCC PRA-98 / G3) TaxID=412133 RepID=A2GYC8_TRIV3|nr:hypothetical protein TVAG_387560 [Trichomonas vaginalis G3]|eukprot:XP_001290769.1 hypothetical protein [Trichomonas vaginalis G3]